MPIHVLISSLPSYVTLDKRLNYESHFWVCNNNVHLNGLLKVWRNRYRERFIQRTQERWWFCTAGVGWVCYMWSWRAHTHLPWNLWSEWLHALNGHNILQEREGLDIWCEMFPTAANAASLSQCSVLDAILSTSLHVCVWGHMIMFFVIMLISFLPPPSSFTGKGFLVSFHTFLPISSHFCCQFQTCFSFCSTSWLPSPLP